MPKKILLGLILLLFGCFAAATISSQEAIDFVQKTNNFLLPNEKPEIFPEVKIRHKNNDFFVVTVLADSSLNGFIPVKDETPIELAEETLARRQLIKTAYVLREVLSIKKAFVEQDQWLFTALNAKFFNDLSSELKNERFDLTTIKSELSDYPDLQDTVDSLITRLNDLYPMADDLAGQLLHANAFESAFTAKPDTNQLSEFKENFVSVFDALYLFDEEKSDYLTELDELKQGIAQTSLPIETKRSLNSLAAAPAELQRINSLIASAINLEEKINEAYNNASTRVATFVDDLSTREKRNNAWVVLYGFDPEIVEKTQQTSVDSVNKLINLILAEEFEFKWKNQATLALMKESWGKAEAYYNNANFELSKDFALKAKQYALKVYKDGLQPDQLGIDINLIVTVAVVLIVFLIVLVILRNRKKLAGLVSKEEEEEKLVFE